MKQPSLTLIAAMDHRRTIGAGGDMPWHLPADLAWFKQQTLGKVLVMGRRTWESIGFALPGRTTIVVSRTSGLDVGKAQQATSLEHALELAGDVDEVMIGGGATIYEACLPRATKMLITVVHAALEGDTFFPAFDLAEWSADDVIHRAADDPNAFDLSFYTLTRSAPPADATVLLPDGLPDALRKNPFAP